MIPKTWQPAIADINNEIESLKDSIANLTFNSDFSHQLQLVKMRAVGIQDRLGLLIDQHKQTAESIRQELAADTAEMLAATRQTKILLCELRQLRAERARANYLHILSLKEQDSQQDSEKGGRE